VTDRAPLATNILVADDTVENLRLLVAMLGGQGYEVRPVTTGRQALLAAERVQPALILLDINMPDISGYEVCEQLKATPLLADIPVIFLTALTDVADKVRAFQVGGVDYITKPFQLEEVHARVRTHLALRQAHLELSYSLNRLREVETLKDNLVKMIVHDMRSPLMALSGHLDLVNAEAGAVLSDVAKGDLQTASRLADRVARMANDLLDVSRLENNKMPLDRAPHDVTALARSVLASLSVLDPGRALDVQIAEAIEVTCDEAVIRRVLENLASNAIKHTPTSARVVVRAKRHDDFVRIEVSDCGAGIPEQVKKNLFEKFAGVQKQHSKYHSAGLGLAFCKLAVHAHGGQIGVEDNLPNGTTFWFTLPSRA
jgi:two-component system, sensor histidine kinase and response regulator